MGYGRGGGREGRRSLDWGESAHLLKQLKHATDGITSNLIRLDAPHPDKLGDGSISARDTTRRTYRVAWLRSTPPQPPDISPSAWPVSRSSALFLCSRVRGAEKKMARSTVLATKTTNTRKRKSTGGIDDGKSAADASNKRRRTLDTFFSPLVTIPSIGGKDSGTPHEQVSLNAEQVRVLQMVVQEEKSVFFTGAAGESQHFPT